MNLCRDGRPCPSEGANKNIRGWTESSTPTTIRAYIVMLLNAHIIFQQVNMISKKKSEISFEIVAIHLVNDEICKSIA